MIINRALLLQLVVFALVGVVATLTHYFVALGAHEVLSLHLYAANLAGYISAVGVSYVGHGKLTFQADLNKQVFRRFVIVSISTFLASEAILITLETGLHLPHRVSLAIVAAIIPAIIFTLNKLWVYRHTA